MAVLDRTRLIDWLIYAPPIPGVLLLYLFVI